MAQSKWDQYGVEAKVIAILLRVKNNSNKPHLFGRPYLSAYQLAIAFAEEYPAETKS